MYKHSKKLGHELHEHARRISIKEHERHHDLDKKLKSKIMTGY